MAWVCCFIIVTADACMYALTYRTYCSISIFGPDVEGKEIYVLLYLDILLFLFH